MAGNPNNGESSATEIVQVTNGSFPDTANIKKMLILERRANRNTITDQHYFGYVGNCVEIYTSLQ